MQKNELHVGSIFHASIRAERRTSPRGEIEGKRLERSKRSMVYVSKTGRAALKGPVRFVKAPANLSALTSSAWPHHVEVKLARTYANYAVV